MVRIHFTSRRSSHLSHFPSTPCKVYKRRSRNGFSSFVFHHDLNDHPSKPTPSDNSTGQFEQNSPSSRSRNIPKNQLITLINTTKMCIRRIYHCSRRHHELRNRIIHCDECTDRHYCSCRLSREHFIRNERCQRCIEEEREREEKKRNKYGGGGGGAGTSPSKKRKSGSGAWGSSGRTRLGGSTGKSSDVAIA